MTEKRFKIMDDEANRIFFKDGLNQHQYYTDVIEDMQCINSFLNSFLILYNEEHKKNEELKQKDEQLTQELEDCKDARKSYKQDWKACVSYCDEYEDEINILKDNIEGLKEENEELKQKLCQIDKLIDDLGHEEMKRQYTNIVD